VWGRARAVQQLEEIEMGCYIEEIAMGGGCWMRRASLVWPTAMERRIMTRRIMTSSWWPRVEGSCEEEEEEAGGGGGRRSRRREEAAVAAVAEEGAL
jgi:hypothetical protein